MDPLFEDESMDVLAQEDGLTESPFQNQHSHYTQPILETCSVEGESVVLPTQICENASVLTEMLSSDLLSEVLTLEDVQHLHTYLPAFQTDLENERQETWTMLFSKQNFMFGNPVENFSRKMECGLYNPDIAQTRNLFQKLQKKNVKREQRNYYFNLLQSVIMSRQQLIEAASQLPPGQTVRVHAAQGNNKIPAGAKTNNLLTDERVRKRYFDELKAIDCFSSEDDNYPEGPPPPLSKKQRRHLGSIQGSLSCDIKPIQSTLTHNLYNQLVVVDNKLDKTLEEEPTRNKIPGPSGEGSCSKQQTADGFPRRSGDPKRFSEDFKPCIDVLSRVSGSKNVYEVNEETYKLMLSRHRSSKREGKLASSEKEMKDTSLEEVGQRVRMCSLNKRPPPPRVLESPKKNKPVVSASSSSDEQESETELPKKVRVKKPIPASAKLTKIKNIKNRPERTESVVPAVEPENNSVPTIGENQVKLEVVDTPRPITPSPVETCPKTPPPPPAPPLPPPPPPSLTQDTHSSFFTLLREVLTNNDYPATLKQTTDAVVVWSSSPISPLNEWYSQLMMVHQRANGWTTLVQSALEFLIDHGLVSAVQDAGQLTAHTWIGQGRDSDALLQDLSGIWLQQQQDSSLEGKLDVEGTSELNDSMLSSPPDATLNLGSGLDLSEDVSDVGSSSLFDSTDVVHPPRSITSWTVRPSTAEEKAVYREQERHRYCQPHKAFTFRQHGYESIVGPVKGVYTPGQGVGQPSTKVRGHNLMVPDRPACVTLLSLVRDAAARLPNGEGTRAEICELMKESQYLAPGAEASLHSVVSGALDRLHYEADPCVKYDSARKVWIYLHRHRSESEFEQLHKQHQGMPSRVKKPRNEQRRSSSVTGSPAAAKTANKTTASVPIPVTSPILATPISQPSCSVPEIQIPVQTPVPVAVLKSTPVKLNNSTIVTVRQEISKPTATTVVAVSHSGSMPTITTPVTVTGITPSTGAGPATIQTFQITTSTGIQTIRVAAPANLPTALLARTLQISAQQQGGLQGQKVIGTPTLVNGNSSIKQVILSPTSKAATLLSSPRAAAPTHPPTTLSVPTSSASSIIRLNIPVTAAAMSGIVTSTARARLPGSPVRLAGRQAVATSTSVASPVQTFLIRPPTPTTAGGGNVPSTSSAPRLVMVNNKLINLSSTPITGQMGPNARLMRPNIAVSMASVRKAVPSSPTTGAARPVLARVVTGPGGGTQQQQVITLENLLSLTNAHHKGGAKTGVVQLPLSAIAGLNVGASSSTNQPTTVLLQNVKGAQSILLPAGFQGGTINIRGVRVATLSQQQQQQPAGQQPKPAFVARLVAPPQPPPPKSSDV